jgi:hypothetical protein
MDLGGTLRRAAFFCSGHSSAPCHTNEYGSIEKTLAPEAVSAVSDWVLKHTTP